MTDRDPDDTTPSAHQPYGQEPAVPPPYGQDPYAQPVHPGQPGPAPTLHPSANTALVLGIVSLAGGLACGLPLLVGPFAWYTGRKVKNEIAAAPQHYSGASEAGAGMVLGIVSTVLLALGLLVVALVVLLLVVGATTA